MDDRIPVRGVGVDPLTLREAVDRVAAWVGEGRTHRGIALNAHKLALRRRVPEVAAELAAADLVIADGVAVTLLARLAGRPLPGRVTGVDLATALLARADTEGWRVALLGGTAEVARALAAPGRWTHHGYFADEEALVDALRAWTPDVLLVGMGSPRQEAFLQQHDGCGAAFAMGVGGSLDVLAGKAERAPRWARRVGLEGAWRVTKEPRKRVGRVLDLLRM